MNFNLPPLENHGYRLPHPTPVHLRADDWRYQLMELEHEELQGVLDTVPRDVLVYWLQWNDPNGIYSDQDCKDEGISPLNLEQAKTYVYHVIMRDDPNWDGRMGNRYIEDFSFLE